MSEGGNTAAPLNAASQGFPNAVIRALSSSRSHGRSSGDTKGCAARHHTTPHHTTQHKHMTAGAAQILTLPFEFADNHSQKGVLWRNMTPPDRHGSPATVGRAGTPRNASSQVQAREAGRFLCHQSVMLVENKTKNNLKGGKKSHLSNPSLLSLLQANPPFLPHFNSAASSPLERIIEVQPALIAAVVLGRKERKRKRRRRRWWTRRTRSSDIALLLLESTRTCGDMSPPA